MTTRQRKPGLLDGETIEAQRHAPGPLPPKRDPFLATMKQPMPPPPKKQPFMPPAPTAAEQAEEKRREEAHRNRSKNFCKKTLKFLFSHIGLCCMVILYSVAGGFVFEHLEKTNEKQECIKAEEKYLPMENETVHKLWKIAQSFEDDEYMEDELEQFQRILRKFRTAVQDLDYDGSNCTNMGLAGGPGYKWSYAGALMFSVTVITTIGYGNIAPKTHWGRLVCIAYATLGIPLMLLFLANIGDVMADIFRYVYATVCCCGCCRKRNKNKVRSLQSLNENKAQNSPDDWKRAYARNKTGIQESDKGPILVDDDEDEDEEEDEKISVPLTVTMAVIGGYIFMGAVLFGVWEGWDSLKASYFCFVTISTIGFGDVVPGSSSFEEAADQYKMVLISVYMIFGMAILSMCFSLIQEEIVAKFRWVGEKLGILEKEKPIDEECEDDNDEDADDLKSKPKPNPNPNVPNPNNRPPPPQHPMMPPGPIHRHPSIQQAKAPAYPMKY